MKKLSRAVRQKRVGGKPMPAVLRQLPTIRRSEVTMIAGQPGAGKSLLALWASQAWVVDFEMKGIYFSADSAELGQACRALAMTQPNLSVAQAEALLEAEDDWAFDQMMVLDNLAFSFEDDMTYDNINEEVQAFVELWGEAPDFIVVDNLTDVEGQSDDEYGTYRRALKALVQLARALDCAVLVLHHTSEAEREDPCPSRKAIQGKCSQKPALILTVADQGSRRPVACVKDRYTGQSDKTGRSAVWFHLNEDTLHWRAG